MADPGFPRGGGANSPGGGTNIRFCQIFPKTAWNWKNLGPRGGGRTSLVPPLDLPLRTSLSLTVCWSLLPGGVCSGGCLLLGGSALGGVCSGGCLLLWMSAPGGGVCSQGVSVLGGVCYFGGSALGGVCSGGCLLRGMSDPGGCLLPGGVCSRGVSALGGCSRGGVYPSMHWGRHPPPPVDRQTFVKILPWPNFVVSQA